MTAQSKKAALAPWESALAGAAGAVVANAIVYPLDIVKTRLQVQTKPRSRKHGTASEGHDGDYHNDDDDDEKEQDVHYNSAADVVQRIVSEDGLSGLYRGIAGSLIGVASTNFAYFYWYSVVRTLYVSTSRKQQRRDGRRHSTRLAPPPSLDTSAELALGALAGALAQLFTIPVSVITTRQQTQKKGEAKGLIETGKEVVSGDDGVRGLWRGLKASLVLVANPAITYAAYQRLRQALFPGKARLRPWQAFALGALSKAIATVATQPLIVAKVGLQSRPPPGRRRRPFRGFVEVIRFIVRHEGALGLFKGIGPQLMKGLLVQGLLMMTKERMEILMLVLLRYARHQLLLLKTSDKAHSAVTTARRLLAQVTP